MKLKNILILTILTIALGCTKKEKGLHNIIGLEINSQPIQEYLNKLEINPEISKGADAYFYMYMPKGIDFRFSNNDTLKAIFLYSEASDNHRQYQGNLPFNLQFTDTRKDIEKKLGPPDRNGGLGVVNYYSSWENEGLSITYKTSDQEDMKNKIHHITIHKINN